MAAESLLGGSVGDNLDDDTKALLDFFLGDTVGGDVEVTTLAGGGTQVVGTGADGELQGAIVSGDVAVAAEVKDGSMTLSINLPAGVNIGFEGLPGDATPEAAQAFMQSRIDDALPADSADPGVQAFRANLQTALDNLFASMGGGAVNVKIVSLTDNSTTAAGALGETPTATGNVITFEAASAGTASEVLTFLMSNIKAGNTLELKGVSNGLLIGDGTVIVSGSQAANLHGNQGNQKITGGTGNDTLVGGGGSDTLDGGAGADVYGFDTTGNFNLAFDKTADKLAFNFAGITKIADLLPFLTGVSEANGSVTYEFVGGAATITLVGVSASEVTADMVKFTI